MWQYILDRFKEPSTYAGLGVLLTGIGVNIDPVLWQEIMGICMGIGGALAIILKTRITPSTVVESDANVVKKVNKTTDK